MILIVVISIIVVEQAAKMYIEKMISYWKRINFIISQVLLKYVAEYNLLLALKALSILVK